MNEVLLKPFNELVPKDQTLIAALVFALADKERQIRDLVAHVRKGLDGEEEQ